MPEFISLVTLKLRGASERLKHRWRQHHGVKAAKRRGKASFATRLNLFAVNLRKDRLRDEERVRTERRRIHQLNRGAKHVTTD